MIVVCTVLGIVGIGGIILFANYLKYGTPF